MISVIIPTYNRGNLIKRAINSILNQTYQNIEIIVVDDCSNDNTEEVVKGINSSKIKYIKHEKNYGACRARNTGIENASGDYIAFLDSDDEWLSDKLEKQLKFMNDKDADIVICNFYYDKHGKKTLKIDKDHSEVIRKEEILASNWVTTGSILVKKEVIMDINGFDESLARYQDWDLILRIMDKYTVYLLNEPLLILYFQEVSITNSTSKKKKYDALIKIYEKNEIWYKNNLVSYSKWCWTTSLYSLYTDNVRIDLMKNSVKYSKFNLKRFITYILVKIGFKDFIKNMYSKNH